MENSNYTIGCGCYLEDGGYFCSRSCKRAAIEERIISSDDIDEEVSNLKLKENVFKNLKYGEKKITKKICYTITEEYYSDGTCVKLKHENNIN
jgi:hypothetical protein